MTVNDINKNLISAIELLAQKNDTEINTTLTIEGVITATIDSTRGAYTVEYMDSKFTAYALSPDIEYLVDDKVYVLVPNGDFTKEKIILTYPTNAADDVITEDSTMVDVSGDILDIPSTISFCTYDKEHYDLGQVENMSADRREYKVSFTNPDLYKRVLQDYFDTYGKFKFSCSLKTNIYAEADSTSRRVNGNYGIYIAIKYWLYEDLDRTMDTLKTSTAVIDINNILGDPYNQLSYCTQTVLIDDIPSGATIATDLDDGIVIKYFAEGFSQVLPENDGYEYDAEGAIVTLKDDLFVKNISLYAVSTLTPEQLAGYSLQLTGSNGNYLTTDSSTYYYKDESGKITTTISKEEYNALPADLKQLYHSKYETTTISITLKKKGKQLLTSKWPCYWFVEDATVNSTDNPGYSSRGGLGWRILNEIKDATKSTYYTNHYTYTVGLAEKDNSTWYDVVSSSATYKCVILYDTLKITKTITIKNIDSTVGVSLESVTGSNKISATAGTAYIRCNLGLESISGYTFSWARYNRNGTYIEALTALQGAPNEVKIPAVYIDTMNTIKCTVYKDKQCIGSDSINIFTADNLGYVVNISNADVLYKYDSDGDSPMSSRYDGTSGSTVTSINPLKVTIFRNDGVELLEEEYRRAVITWELPVNSLLEFPEGYTSQTSADGEHYIYTTTGWEANQNGIDYSIAATYKADLNDNTIKLTIEVDGVKITNSTTIMFLKDGEDGTNGSAYSAVITFQGMSPKVLADDGTPHRFQLYYDGSSLKYFNYYTNSLESFYDEASAAEAATRRENRMVLNQPGKFDVKVYYNGEDITQEEETEYSVYKWSIVNYNSGNSNIISIGEDSVGDVTYNYIKPNLSNWNSSLLCTILQAQIKIGSRSYIYAYYPIDIIKVSSFSANTRYYYLGGFNSVMFSSEGSSPKYANNKYFEFYRNTSGTETKLPLNIGTKDYLTIDEEASALKIKKKTLKDDNGNKIGEEYTLAPKTNFNGEANNYAIFNLSGVTYCLSVYMYYDTSAYGNMIIWDGTSIKVDGDAKIISSQVLSGVSKDTGFTGLTIGQTTGNSSSDNSKNGLLAFHNGTQTAYISAETGASYFGVDNELSLAVPVPNTTNSITNNFAGFNFTKDRIYDDFGIYTSALYSNDANQTSVYKAIPESDASTHKTFIRTGRDTNKFIASYDGSMFSNYGSIGGWIIGEHTLTSQDGSMVLDSANNKITYTANSVISDLMAKIKSLEDRVKELEDAASGTTPTDPEETTPSEEGEETTS